MRVTVQDFIDEMRIQAQVDAEKSLFGSQIKQQEANIQHQRNMEAAGVNNQAKERQMVVANLAKTMGGMNGQSGTPTGGTGSPPVFTGDNGGNPPGNGQVVV
jgi:hypothetical protein